MRQILFSMLGGLVFLISFIQIADAGLMQYSGQVNLEPFSKVKVCEMGLYSTNMINGTYVLGYSKNIQPFVKSIQPSEPVFLASIDLYGAPQEGEKRREFVKQICIENNTDSCLLTCTEFQGLGLKKISFDLGGAKEELIIGQVYDIVKIREGTGKEVLQFIVVYTSFDGRLIIVGIFVLIAIIGSVVFYVRRKKPKPIIPIYTEPS